MVLFEHPTDSLTLLATNIKPFVFEANTQCDVVMQLALRLWAAPMLAAHMAWFVVYGSPTSDAKRTTGRYGAGRGSPEAERREVAEVSAALFYSSNQLLNLLSDAS
jgi:hypothetical protein